MSTFDIDTDDYLPLGKYLKLLRRTDDGVVLGYDHITSMHWQDIAEDMEKINGLVDKIEIEGDIIFRGEIKNFNLKFSDGSINFSYGATFEGCNIECNSLQIYRGTYLKNTTIKANKITTFSLWPEKENSQISCNMCVMEYDCSGDFYGSETEKEYNKEMSEVLKRGVDEFEFPMTFCHALVYYTHHLDTANNDVMPNRLYVITKKGLSEKGWYQSKVCPGERIISKKYTGVHTHGLKKSIADFGMRIRDRAPVMFYENFYKDLEDDPRVKRFNSIVC